MDIERIINRLMQDEGFSQNAYWDNEQYSYGFGCRAPHGSAVISYKEAASLLADEVQYAIKDFESIFRDCRENINEIRAEALVNMAFNLGKTKLLKFRKMIAAIRRNDWLEAAYQAQNSAWYGQVGNRAKRIVKELATGEVADAA
jgi:lysozyme